MDLLQGKFYEYENAELGKLNAIIMENFDTKKQIINSFRIAFGLDTKDKLVKFIQLPLYGAFTNFMPKEENYLAKAITWAHAGNSKRVELEDLAVRVNKRRYKIGQNMIHLIYKNTKENDKNIITGINLSSESRNFYIKMGLAFYSDDDYLFTNLNENPHANPGYFELDEVKSNWVTEILNNY